MKTNCIDKFNHFGGKNTKNPLDYKPPKNAKYQQIKPVVNTGITMKNVDFKSDKYISKRKDENFHRIQWNILKELICKQNNSQSIYGLIQNHNDDSKSVKSHQSQQSKVSQIKQDQIGLNIKNSEFLLVDARQSERHAQFKIVQSLNYPQQHIRQGKYIKQLYDFKNAQNKIVIVYGLDQKQGIQSAREFFEKGYDNIYLITGGIQKVALKCPELIVGTIPPEILKNKKIIQQQKIFVKRSIIGDTTLGFQKQNNKLKPKNKNK